jgi:hypothetical protein
MVTGPLEGPPLLQTFTTKVTYWPPVMPDVGPRMDFVMVKFGVGRGVGQAAERLKVWRK